MKCIYCGEISIDEICYECWFKLSKGGMKPPSFRKIVVEKYGNKCYYCGKKLTKATFSIDHKIPLSRGGTNSLSNIVPCCQDCNLEKRAKTDEEFLASKNKMKDNA